MTIRERLWRKATLERRKLAAVGLASFLVRFYERYDAGDRYQQLRRQVAWLWDVVRGDPAAGEPPVDVGRAADRLIPDVDTSPSGDAAIGQVAALAVATATDAVSGKEDDADPDGIWEEFDECLEHAAETEEDEVAYSAGLDVVLRGLSVEQVMAGMEALNKMPRRSQRAKRVRSAFREVEAAVKEMLAAPDNARDAAARMRARLDRVQVVPLLHRWTAPGAGQATDQVERDG